jgi:hypothetical protein
LLYGYRNSRLRAPQNTGAAPPAATAADRAL